jgi:serine/threonine protein kinase
MFKYIGNGSYRQVFLAKLPTENVIFKEANWDNGHESGFHTDEYEFMRQDMVVGESFTSNPRFVDIYGFCALSMFSEFMPFGDAEVMAQTIFDRHNPPSIKEGGELVIFNNLTGTEKLEYALQMADAVSYLHNYPGGVIVHDDIQMPQFLLTADKRIKLNDFNRAEVMLFDEENNEYCKYRNNPGHGDWRSPEEYYDKPLDEKIDIYSLGNNFYALLTGMGPFYEEAHSDGVIKKVKAGMKPYIDQRFLERSFAEKKLAEIMVLCWEYDPVKRPDINTLVQVLREAVEENLRLQPV